jgi:hypothetical protein
VPEPEPEEEVAMWSAHDAAAGRHRCVWQCVTHGVVTESMREVPASTLKLYYLVTFVLPIPLISKISWVS